MSVKTMNPSRTRIFAAALAGSVAGVGILATVVPGIGEAAMPAQVCIRPAAWTLLDGDQPRGANADALLAEMAKKDVVLLGERHDAADDHRWQQQVLAALNAQRPNMVIGFEMFPRRVQPVLDSWVAGKLTVKQLLEQTQWDSVWTLPADLYLPLFQFARINRVPMVALNIDKTLSRAVADKGWEAIPEAEREGVGRAAPPSQAYHDLLFEVYRQHSGMLSPDGAKVEKPDAAFDRFVESQTAWDRAMAEALARYTIAGSAADKPLVVGVMGSGHIQFGYGVPHQLRDLGVKSIGTLLPVPVNADCDGLRPGLADAVFALPEMAQAKPEPPRLGVQLQENAGAVRIVDVAQGSLAEKSGLKTGDQLAEVAGLPPKGMFAVVATIRQQPAGTWLPLRVKRGDDTLELVVKFPPAQ